MYYIMSSLNYNTMMATHTICSENHYKKRLYGSNRFMNIKSDDYKYLIRLYEEIPKNVEKLLINNDLAEYIVIVELIGLDKIKIIDNKFYYDGIIYLDSINHNIKFLNSQDEKLVKVKSKIVLEVKDPIYSIVDINTFTGINLDNYRNTMKGSCLIAEYVKKELGINVIFKDNRLDIEGISKEQVIVLNNYFDKIVLLKNRWKNKVTEDNLAELEKVIYEDIAGNDMELIYKRFKQKEWSISHSDIKDIFYKGLFLFMLKYKNFEELNSIQTDKVSKAIAMILYGAYHGFASINRIIYESVEKQKFNSSWNKWEIGNKEMKR